MFRSLSCPSQPVGGNTKKRIRWGEKTQTDVDSSSETPVNQSRKVETINYHIKQPQLIRLISFLVINWNVINQINGYNWINHD